MFKRLAALCLVLAVFTSTLGFYSASYATPDFTALRTKWVRMTLGGVYQPTSDPNSVTIDGNTITDPNVKEYIKKKIANLNSTNCINPNDPSNVNSSIDPNSSTAGSSLVDNLSKVRKSATAYKVNKANYNTSTYRGYILQKLEGLWGTYNTLVTRAVQSGFTSKNYYNLQIEIPQKILDICCQMYNEIPATDRAKYLATINSATTSLYGDKGANKIESREVNVIYGILNQEETKISNAASDLGEVLSYRDNLYLYNHNGQIYTGTDPNQPVTEESAVNTTKDGVYKDGSFIEHGYYAYNGGYGYNYLISLGKLIQFFDKTLYQIPNLNNAFNIIKNSYQPILYYAYDMDMVRGRDVAKSDSDDWGDAMLWAIVRIISNSSPSTQTNDGKPTVEDIKKVAGWARYSINSVTQRKDIIIRQASFDLIPILSNLCNYATFRINDTNNTIETITDYPESFKYYEFANMGRSLQVVNDTMTHYVNNQPAGTENNLYSFGVSKSSKRTNRFEVLGCNFKSWYTGEGMTYLNLKNDPNQYSDYFWPTIDCQMIPGTTVSSLKRNKIISDPNHHLSEATNDFCGGVSFLEKYGVSGMEVNGPIISQSGSSISSIPLHAKKSWFMFDDEIVALGTDVTNTDPNNTTYTVIENRKVKNPEDPNDPNNLVITINSLSQQYDFSMFQNSQQLSTGIRWIQLNYGTNSNVGYYFPLTTPSNPKIFYRNYTSRGDWNELADETYDPNDPNDAKPENIKSRCYSSFYFNHETNTSDPRTNYSYALLPNKTAEDTQRYATNPDITIIKNDSVAQAVYEKNTQITGINIWDPSGATVGNLSCNKAASIMYKKVGNILEVAISDPTFINNVDTVAQTTGTISLSISNCFGLYGLDPSNSDYDFITYNQTGNTLNLTVNVNQSKGKTFKARFLKL